MSTLKHTFPFMQVDAFTDRPFAGNPCAVVFEADNLDDTTMLAIAREMNLAETAFVRQSSVADFSVRYFTPAIEIPFAGHPTVATAFALVESGRLQPSEERLIITFDLPAGVIPVEILFHQGEVVRVVMTQNQPRFLQVYDPARVLPIFGLPTEALLPDNPIQTVSTGTPQLMIPLRGLSDLRQARLDVPAFKAFREAADFYSPHLFCLQGATPGGRTFARHLDAPPDLLEDPFTGSATGGMGAYLWRYGLIEEPTFTAEQGHWMGRPGLATVEVIGPRQDIRAVKVGGAAALVARGELFL